MDTSTPRLRARMGVARNGLALALLGVLPLAFAAPSTTILQRDAPSPSLVGQGVLVSARVDTAGVAPTGLVTIGDGVDSCTAVLPEATCLWTPGTPGDKNLVAQYAGDATYTASQSAPRLHTVLPVGLPARASLGNPLTAFQPDGAGSDMAVSADGRFVAFVSTRSDLVPNDSNGVPDVFLVDRMTGEVERVSVAGDGSQGNAESGLPDISADGRRVLFLSEASNLVAGDGNGRIDVFLRDRSAGTTQRISVASGGTEANGDSTAAALSGDGRRIAFASTANTLVGADGNGVADIFLRDLDAASTTRLSVSSAGVEANGASSEPSVNHDGGRVAFLSSASNLVAVDSNGVGADLFVRDVGAASTRIGSLNDAAAVTPTQAIDSAYPGISGDGRYVAFASSAAYVAGDAAGLRDLFRTDLDSNTTVRVSLADDEQVPNAAAAPRRGRGISFDGQRLLFASAAGNLVAGDGNGVDDLFLRDVVAGSTRRLSLRADGSDSASAVGDAAVLSADGLTAAFSVPADGGYIAGGAFAFAVVREIEAARNRGLLAETVGTQLRAQATFAALGRRIAVSADGRFVAFSSNDDHLVSGDRNRIDDVFLRDRQTGSTVRVSVATGGVEANNGSFAPALSADGRYVVFSSLASNLVAGDGNGVVDVFRHDRSTGETLRVSAAPDGGDGNGGSSDAVMSADGRFVAFTSVASNLAGGGDANATSDVFLWDAQQPAATRIRRLSLGPGNSDVTAASGQPSIAADGSRVAFASESDQLLPGILADGLTDVFVHEVASGTLSLASRLANGSEGGLAYAHPQLGADGSRVAFLASAGGEDIEGDGVIEVAAGPLVVLRELAAGSNRVVSRCAGPNLLAALPTGAAPPPYALDAAGRYVAFTSATHPCTPDDTVAAPHVYVRDLGLGETRLVDRNAAGEIGQGAAGGSQGGSLAFSGNGQFIAFASFAPNLVAGDSNGRDDIFLAANPAFRSDLLQAVSNLTPVANGPSGRPVISESGRYVLFESAASNAASAGPADSNGATDIFRLDLETGLVQRVSLGAGGQQIDGPALQPQVSADGQLLLFIADEADVPMAKNESPAERARRKGLAGGLQLYSRDLVTGAVVPRGIVAGSAQELAELGESASLAPDKSWLGYATTAPAEPGDDNGVSDVVVLHLATGTRRCISCFRLRPDGSATTTRSTEPSADPSIDSAGRRLSFTTGAGNLSEINAKLIGSALMVQSGGLTLGGGTITMEPIDTTLLAQQEALLGNTRKVKGKGRINRQNNREIILSTIRNIQAKGEEDAAVLLFDTRGNRVVTLSDPPGGGVANGSSGAFAVSGDGLSVVFESSASNLDASEPDTNGVTDLYVRDLRSNTVRRLSRTRDGDEADAASTLPAIDYNGTRIVFQSAASNLDGSDADAGQLDLFLRRNPLNTERVFLAGFE